jgi:lysophospholipid acyltransferase (LPLAT)-like uncharacterized protein
MWIQIGTCWQILVKLSRVKFQEKFCLSHGVVTCEKTGRDSDWYRTHRKVASDVKTIPKGTLHTRVVTKLPFCHWLDQWYVFFNTKYLIAKEKKDKEAGSKTAVCQLWYSKTAVCQLWYSKTAVYQLWYSKTAICQLWYSKTAVCQLWHSRTAVCRLWYSKTAVCQLWYSKTAICQLWHSKQRLS